MKARSLFVCTGCGSSSVKWLGRCPECGEYGTMLEERVRSGPVSPAHSNASTQARPQPLDQAPDQAEERVPTGLGELDRVLGGGLVRGSVILVGGEPGIGKSTLLLQAAHRLAERGGRVLLVSGEESPEQVRMRASRLSALSPRLFLLCATEVGEVCQAAEEIAPSTLIIDSIQTIYSPELDAAPGGVSQVRDCAARLQALAKEKGIPTFLVGHVTKDGTLAGPRVLEHMVDTVLYFEGERYDSLRVLRAAKNRFGSAAEVGVFEMGDEGLREVEDPSLFFSRLRGEGFSGSVPVVTMEGKRPLLVEVQALVTPSSLPVPKRVAAGLDQRRFTLDLAVLEKRAGLRFSDHDVFAGTSGGLSVAEPACDLGVCMAVASSLLDRPLPRGMAVFGEVGLTGEIRPVSQAEARLREVGRLGFREVMLPSACEVAVPPGLRLSRISHVKEALAACGLQH